MALSSRVGEGGQGMATLACRRRLAVLAWSLPMLLGCSGPAASVATQPQRPLAAPLEDPPPCYRDGVENAPGAIIIDRCKETNAASGRCADAMCKGCLNNGMWSASFECVP